MDRFDRLVSLGKLTEKRARKLAQALDYHDKLAALPPPGFLLRCVLFLNFRVPRPDEINVSLLLAGRIDQREYLRRERFLWLGFAPIGYTLWMLMGSTAFEFLRTHRPPTFDRGLLIGGLCTVGGLAFGGLMYLASRLFSRRWIRLRRLLDDPPEGFRDPP